MLRRGSAAWSRRWHRAAPVRSHRDLAASSEDAEGRGECEEEEEHAAQDEDASLRQIVGKVRAGDDRGTRREEVAGNRARAHAERIIWSGLGLGVGLGLGWG